MKLADAYKSEEGYKKGIKTYPDFHCLKHVISARYGKPKDLSDRSAVF